MNFTPVGSLKITLKFFNTSKQLKEENFFYVANRIDNLFLCLFKEHNNQQEFATNIAEIVNEFYYKAIDKMKITTYLYCGFEVQWETQIGKRICVQTCKKSNGL
jgi:hypothetical protein